MVVAATAATWALTRTTTGWGLLVSLVLLGLLLLAVGDILPTATAGAIPASSPTGGCSCWSRRCGSAGPPRT